jgi:hypothetical protein
MNLATHDSGSTDSGTERQIVEGLVSMALALMETPSWPNLQHIHLDKLMLRVWGNPILTLTASTEALRQQQQDVAAAQDDNKSSVGGVELRPGDNGETKEEQEALSLQQKERSMTEELREMMEFDTTNSTTTGSSSTDDREEEPQQISAKVELQYVDPESVSSDALAGSQMPSV